MHLQSLSLTNFRNFHQVGEIEFPGEAVLVAAAPNATGKTNFLESIVVLLRGKSFRGRLDQCVQWGEDGMRLKGQINHQDGAATLSLQYHAITRKMKIEENQVPISLVSLYTTYPFVLFVPDDTQLFSRGPAMRRNFYNHVLVSSPAYLSALVQYHRVLRQRNAALKHAKKPEDIQNWTDLLQEYAAPLWQQRQLLAEYLNTHVGTLYQEIFGEGGTVAVRLVPGTKDMTIYGDTMREAWSFESRYHYTMYGPHRDDLEVLIDNRPAQAVLSRGQMRALILAMKLVVHQFLEKATGQMPLLLLDEALAELDDDRQERLLRHLPSGAQTLLTCTKVPAILRGESRAHLLDLRSILVTPHVDAVPEAVPVAVAG